jgi:hypothetical protein
MKYENLMLSGLFVACLLVCILVLGTMLRTPSSQQLATAGIASALLATPAQCALPADGVICPQHG